MLGDGTALFKRRAWLEEFSPGSGPDVARRVYLDARRAGGWLLGDGERLYALDDDGRLTLLRDDVERASAP